MIQHDDDDSGTAQNHMLDKVLFSYLIRLTHKENCRVIPGYQHVWQGGRREQTVSWSESYQGLKTNVILGLYLGINFAYCQVKKAHHKEWLYFAKKQTNKQTKKPKKQDNPPQNQTQ
jgi:hypothetical protein